MLATHYCSQWWNYGAPLKVGNWAEKEEVSKKKERGNVLAVY